MLEYYIKVLASHLYKYTYPSINTTQVDHGFVVTLCMYISTLRTFIFQIFANISSDFKTETTADGQASGAVSV